MPSLGGELNKLAFNTRFDWTTVKISLRRDSSRCPSVRMVNMSVREILALKRTDIIELARKHGASQIRLIGSVARGEERPDSDVDFLVTWEAWTSLLDCAALTLELERVLGRNVDLASDGWVRPDLRESVYRDAWTL